MMRFFGEFWTPKRLKFWKKFCFSENHSFNGEFDKMIPIQTHIHRYVLYQRWYWNKATKCVSSTSPEKGSGVWTSWRNRRATYRSNLLLFTERSLENRTRTETARQVLMRVPIFRHSGPIEELPIDRFCSYLPNGFWRIESEMRRPDKCWWGYRFSDILAQ